ncbi:hypothetical protein WMF45_10495 [Sorangium sp. So ce448]|uniref:hypothetical protein n=1 Tax=Sorangium sp. So ce448 TaxID=3133314 RepID=UPI003F608F04
MKQGVEGVEEERRAAQERVSRRLGAIAAVAAAAVMATIVVWALEQRGAARNAEAAARRAEDAQREAAAQAARARASSLMAGARELLARNQPESAVQLLLEVRDADGVRGWTDLTRDVLASASFDAHDARPWGRRVGCRFQPRWAAHRHRLERRDRAGVERGPSRRHQRLHFS